MLREVSDIWKIVQLQSVEQQNVQTLVCLNYHKYLCAQDVYSRSQWPHGLRLGSAAAPLL